MARKPKDIRPAEILLAIAATNINHVHRSCSIEQAIGQLKAMQPTPETQGVAERLVYELINGILGSYIHLATAALEAAGYQATEVTRNPSGVAASELVEQVGRMLENQKKQEEATEPAAVEV